MDADVDIDRIEEETEVRFWIFFRLIRLIRLIKFNQLFSFQGHGYYFAVKETFRSTRHDRDAVRSYYEYDDGSVEYCGGGQEAISFA